MAFYRVLVADDEEEIRDGVLRAIDWRSLGFEVVGSAENGREALEKAETLKPDVVMTDIKMPFLSGLALGECLRRILPNTKIILFSGFDRFDYAQQGIALNVYQYVLKPIHAAELAETLSGLKDTLDREAAERQSIEILRTRYAESLPVLREQFLVSLLEGRAPLESIAERAELYGIDAASSRWAVALVRADGFADGSFAGDGRTLKERRELVPVTLRRAVDETLGDAHGVTVFFHGEHVVVLAGFAEERSILQFASELDAMCRSGERLWGLRMSAGLGGAVGGLGEIEQSYRGARDALDYRTILGRGRAIFIRDVEPDTSARLELGEEDERALVSAAKFGDETEIARVFDRLFSRLDGLLLPFEQYHTYLIEILTALLRAARAQQQDAADAFGSDCYRTLGAFGSLDEAKAWLMDGCGKIGSAARRGRTDSVKLLAETARTYIETHFRDSELSVDTLCGVLHVSPAYFSTVFKRETGVSFVSYLTETRLRQAVALLNSTDLKTYQIAEQVGYTEPNYFSYSFKKRFGVSPSQYRNT